MTGRTWVCADHHFGHRNILTFKRDDDTPLRNFSSIEEHDETIIENHNKLVHPNDRVYMLGDVVINRRNLPILSRLNGRLCLVRGNHDIFKLKDYLPYFDDIRAYVVQLDSDKNKVIMSHIPIHPESLGRWGINIHGHLHYNRVMRRQDDFSLHGDYIDPKYKCVSLEHTNFKPIEIHEALKL